MSCTSAWPLRGKIGPSLRLEATGTAKTLHKGHQPPLVVDGPFAETKEALLGFYVVDVETKEEAVAIAKDLNRPILASARMKYGLCDCSCRVC